MDNFHEVMEGLQKLRNMVLVGTMFMSETGIHCVPSLLERFKLRGSGAHEHGHKALDMEDVTQQANKNFNHVLFVEVIFIVVQTM